MKVFIGVDLGTTGIRAGVYREDFKLLGIGYGKSIIKKGARGELYQEPEEMYSEAALSVSNVLKEAGVQGSEVACISFCGQMAGIMGIGVGWKPQTPYDSWLDTRCAPQVDIIKQKAQELVISKTGNIPSFNHGPKILWWNENEKKIFKSIKSFIQPSAYVAGKLCGLSEKDAFVDWTFLHFSGFADNKNLKWDEKLTSIFGVPPEKLPKIVSPFTIIGETVESSSKLFGIPAEIPVAAGCGDTASSLLGTGAVQTGIAVDVAGTASVFAMTTESMISDSYGLVYGARSVVEDLWYAMSYINGGGMNLEWFRDTFSPETSFKELDREAENIPHGSEKLIFIPHLEGRAYPSVPRMRGKWSGFTRTHTRAHFYRSILEGTGYEYALYKRRIENILKSSTSYDVRVIGGGSKSRIWNQIKSDILGCPYSTLDREDVSLLGQALIAAKAAGYLKDIKDALRNVVKVKERFVPNEEFRNVYNEMIKIYENILNNQI